LAGVPRKLRLRRFLRGFAVRVTPSEAAALEIELRARTRRAQVSRALSSGLAHRSLPVQAAQTFNLILARRALPLAAGARRVRLRPARRLVGRPRRFRAELVVTATDAAGNRRVVRRQIAVRR
jgi:hypothetical protein